MKTMLTLVAFVLLIPAAAGAQDGRLNLSFLDRLADRASEKQVIDIPAELLRNASGFVPSSSPGAEAAKQVLSGLQGVYVRSFEFDDPKAYSLDDIAIIRKQLSSPGWSKIVSNEEKDRSGNWELQEVYFFQQGGKMHGIFIINAEPGELQVVNIVGPIDFEKLAALGGVLGIPRNIGNSVR